MQSIRFFSLTLLIFLSISIYPQAGTWTWMKGDSISNDIGNYGVQGVPSVSNNPPSSYACGYWTDSSGSFWIYLGGLNGTDGIWKFDPKLLMWSWMLGDTPVSTAIPAKINSPKGVYNPLNSPGSLAFGMFTWITPNNHLWLFGGAFAPINNNLWQYDPSINQWAWMGNFGPPDYGTMGIGDSSTKPGGRCEGNCSWTDINGNLWLFGGFDSSSNSHNDMWKYDISDGIWTWMSGSANSNDEGSYGIIGQPSVNNYPASRSTNMFWKDNEGNFWISGGMQFHLDTFFYDIMFQDIWKFNPNTLEWTWVKGSPTGDTSKIGNNCVRDSLDKDGRRYENRAVWKLTNDIVVTYGGFPDYDTLNGQNDLWAYKMSTNDWIKINEWPAEGRYGLQGVADDADYPPTRYGSVGFKDKENNLWIFGGQNDAFQQPSKFYDDLWKYIPDTACIGAITSGVQQVQEEEQMQLYPNPCSVASVQLAVGNELIGSRLALYDIQGQLVFQSAIRNPQSEIPVSGLAAGVYFVQVSSPNGSVVRKLVKI